MKDMIDCINDTLVSMRFAINQQVHIEILIVKLTELVTRNRQQETQQEQPNQNISSDVENKIKQLEAQITQLSQNGVQPKAKPVENKQGVARKQSKHVFSIRQIERVLDHANRDDLNLLKEKWQAVIESVKQKDQRALVSLLLNSEPVAASEDHVLVKFDEDIHCEIVNKNDEKREHIESIVCEIVNKTVKVVGVPNSQWLQVRQQYIQSKKANPTETKNEPEQEKLNPRLKYIKGLISRILIAVIFVLGSIIYTNYSDNNKKLYQHYVLENSLSFTKINNLYQDLFGEVDIINKKKNDATTVFKNGINYKNIEDYKNGSKLTIGINEIVNAIKSGIVVYIGEKDDLGNTIIIQGNDGVDIWYSNITDTDIKVYDYIEAGNILGTSNGDFIYLTINKDGKYLSYEEYTNIT